MEIADVFAVNKADREGADRTVRDLAMMLELRRSTATRPPPDHDGLHRSTAGEPWSPEDARFWEPPIVKTVAIRGDGVEDLAAAVERHRGHLESTGMRADRDTARARAAFVALLRERLLSGALAWLAGEKGHLDEIAARIATRQADPYALVDDLAARLHR
jgi:LAO/AO transport system kinase